MYLFDAVTGEETDLLPAGETFSSYPLWSPDGNWVSALTAGKRPDATGTSLDAYDVYLAEDGPAAVARNLTVKSRPPILLEPSRREVSSSLGRPGQ